jgi:hypothetical protein
MGSLRFFRWHNPSGCTVNLMSTQTFNRNKYQGYLLVGYRRLVCMPRNSVTFMCRLSRNPGSLNLLEPPGPVQACNGIAVHYLLSYIISLLTLNGVYVVPTAQFRTFAILSVLSPFCSYVRHFVHTFAILCACSPFYSNVRHFIRTFAILFVHSSFCSSFYSYLRHFVRTFAILFLRSSFYSYVRHFVRTFDILFVPSPFCSYVRHFVRTIAFLFVPSPFCSYRRHFVRTFAILLLLAVTHMTWPSDMTLVFLIFLQKAA